MKSYSYFNQLKRKAALKFDKYGSLEDQLERAATEIECMREEEVPEDKWGEVLKIKNSFKTHEAISNEGTTRASIRNMSEQQKQQLKNAIISL